MEGLTVQGGDGMVQAFTDSVAANGPMWAGAFALLVVLCVVLLYCWYNAACQRDEGYVNAATHAAVDGGGHNRYMGAILDDRAGSWSQGEANLETHLANLEARLDGCGCEANLEARLGGRGEQFLGNREGPWFGGVSRRLDEHQSSASKATKHEAAAAAGEPESASEGFTEGMSGTEDALARVLRQ